MVQLKTIIVPGLADCLKRERQVRDEAFLEGMPEDIAGIPVATITLRHLHWLTMMRNGFFVPCTFDDYAEQIEHAQQALWVLSPGLLLPNARQPYSSAYRLRSAFAKTRAAIRFICKDPRRIIPALNDYIEEAFFDNPFKGTDKDDGIGHSHPAIIASILDVFAAGGYSWTRDEILDTPLKQIWQLCRLTIKRLNPDSPCPNPSDILKVEAVHKQNMERRAAQEALN